MKEIKRFGLVDLETRQEYAVMVAPMRRRMGGKWLRVFQDGTNELLGRAKELHGQSCRILLYLTAEADWTNRVPSVGELAEKLGMKVQGVSRAYRELYNSEFLTKKGRDYYLSPFYCWKGTPAQFEEAMKDLPYPYPRLVDR